MYQPHRILEYPLVTNVEEFKKIGKDAPKRVDDEIYFKSMSHLLNVNIEFGVGGMLIGVWLLFPFDGTIRIVPLFFIFGGLFWLIYALTVNKKNKIFELNRLEGLITYPDSYYRPPLKGKFKDLKAVISVSGNIDGYVDREYLKFVNTFKPRKITTLYTLYGDPKKEWSFYVWYMDKNRPLPLGTAFDPYRQQDFERRKAEGFPKPLFPSEIPTPEATPEQQAERERIGGW